MPTSLLEVADIFRAAGAGYRAAQAGHLSLAQLKVMSAIENCRTAALGGHVEGCDDCGHLRIAYNSCRNRHCPKCQGAAARTWLAEREADLLPVGYFHVVFTLPTEVADIAWQNKAVVYDLLFRAASETMMRIAADPRHLGARIGITAVLHTWGSAMTHHPHVHMIVPGGGISPDGMRWIASRAGFLLPVRVLGKVFRRLFLSRLLELASCRQARLIRRPGRSRRPSHVRPSPGLTPQKEVGGLCQAALRRSRGGARLSGPLHHRVAISNRRLIAFDAASVTFRYKDYRRSGSERQQVMTLDTHEFMRRFLLHVLPRGFHSIRHYGLLASSTRKANIARARELLAVAPPAEPAEPVEPSDPLPPCPCCGGRMRIIETFGRWSQPRAPPQASAPTGTVSS